MAASRVLVFLDANALIDLYLSRPRLKKLSQVLAEINGQLVTSVLSVELCSYISRKEKDRGLKQLQDFMNGIDILALADSTLSLSFRIAQDEDLEDALQVACALENAVDVFITGDVKLAKRYGHLLKIKLITV